MEESTEKRRITLIERTLAEVSLVERTPVSQKKILSFTLMLFAAPLFLNAQHLDFTERIHIPLWAEIDAEPGLSAFAEKAETKQNETLTERESTSELDTATNNTSTSSDSTDETYSFAISRLHKTAPYLLNGMVYGWSFVYVPYDKMRGVKEYFEVTEINTIQPSDGPITYAKPWIQDNLLYCWAEFTRTPQMIWNLKAWSSITSKKAHGRGTGKSRDGFKGIQDAAEDALKDALRSYYREILKNKPKEIDGRVIIRSTPKIGLKAGQYIVELDFFLETDRIVKYTQF